MKGQFHFSIGGVRFLSNGPGKGLELGAELPHIENFSKYPLGS